MNITITGTNRPGYTLTATVDPATPGTFTWAGNGTAAGNTYVVDAADARNDVTATFTYMVDDEENAESATVRIKEPEHDINSAFKLLGDHQLGETISIDTEDGDWAKLDERENWSASAKTYQWFYGEDAIAGATSDTLTITEAEERKTGSTRITLAITYQNSLGQSLTVVSNKL